MRVRKGTTYSQMYSHGTVWRYWCNASIQVHQIVLYTYAYYACIKNHFMHRCLAVAALLRIHAARRKPLTCGITKCNSRKTRKKRCWPAVIRTREEGETKCNCVQQIQYGPFRSSEGVFDGCVTKNLCNWLPFLSPTYTLSIHSLYIPLSYIYKDLSLYRIFVTYRV